MSKTKSVWNLGDKLMLLNDENLQENRLYTYYEAMALNRFKWVGLPETVESRHIEKALFHQGQAFFYNDPEKGIICLPCNECKELNHYGDPIGVTITGHNFQKIKTVIEGVRILDNDLHYAPVNHLYYYVQLLARVEMTITMNLEQQKFPLIIPTTKANELTMKNVMGMYSDFTPTIFTDEKLANALTDDNEGLKAIKTDVPYLLDKLVQFKKDCQNELYTFLGLNNVEGQKKERMLVDEVNVNNGTILMSLDLSYKTRQKACEEINKKFGLNISVEKTIEEFDQIMNDNTGDKNNEE